MLDKEEKPYMSTTAAIEYYGKSKSSVKPVTLLQRILDRAAILNDIDTIKYMKDNNVNQIPEIKVTQSLVLAIEHQQEDASVALIEWDSANVSEFVDSETFNTFIHLAALKGMSKTCSALFANCPSMDIDARNRNKSTALHCAVASGDINTVRIILNAGASAKIKNDHKNTALTLAKLYNQQDIVSCLENYGLNRKSDKSSPLSDPLAPVSSSRISRIE